MRTHAVAMHARGAPAAGQELNKAKNVAEKNKVIDNSEPSEPEQSPSRCRGMLQCRNHRNVIM